jgi:hypothetical protein
LFFFVFSNVGQINPFTLIYPQVHNRVKIPNLGGNHFFGYPLVTLLSW